MAAFACCPLFSVLAGICFFGVSTALLCWPLALVMTDRCFYRLAFSEVGLAERAADTPFKLFLAP